MAKTSTLVDDFQDGVIGGIWVTAGTVAETGGRARLTPATTFAFLRSATTYDNVGSYIVGHIPVATNTGTTGSLQSGMTLTRDGDNQAAIRKISDRIECVKEVAGVTTIVYTATYNPATHVYWRMRESAGIFYWDVSAAGTSWTNLFNTTVATNLFPVNVVYVEFYSGWSSGFELSPGTFEIESVNAWLSLTASGASTSSGNAQLLIKHLIAGSGASTSSGSADISIPPLTAHALTSNGSSTSTGSSSIVIIPVIADTHQISASGSSTSTGTASFTLAGTFTASGSSFSDGSASISIVHISSAPRTFTFSPPIVYDVPPTLPGDPRNRLAKWYNNRARGRSILKLTDATTALYPSNALYPSDSLFPLITTGADTYMIVDTPTVDQMAAAVFTYMGGRIYNIDADEANSLLNAGFSVIQEISGEVEILLPGSAV